MTFEKALKLLSPLTSVQEGMLWDWARGQKPLNRNEALQRIKWAEALGANKGVIAFMKCEYRIFP